MRFSQAREAINTLYLNIKKLNIRRFILTEKTTQFTQTLPTSDTETEGVNTFNYLGVKLDERVREATYQHFIQYDIKILRDTE